MSVNRIDYQKIDGILQSDPQMTWGQFHRAHPKIRMSDVTFYARKKKLQGVTKDAEQSSLKGIKFQRNSKILKLVKILQKNPEGVSEEELLPALKLKHKSLREAVSRLKHRKGIMIEAFRDHNDKDALRLVGGFKVADKKAVMATPERKDLIAIPTPITRAMVSGIVELPASDQEDALAQLKLVNFHTAAFLAIFQSNDYIKLLRTNLNMR